MLRSVVTAGVCDKLLSNFSNLSVSIQQTRNTVMLKRRYPPGLHAKGSKVPRMRGRHFVYNVVKDTEREKRPRVKLILTDYIKGLGNTGDILELGPYESYKKVLLPRLGVYCTPDNMEKYCSANALGSNKRKFSSPFVENILRELKKTGIPIQMNYSNEWTLQPWHVKMALRNIGYIVPEEAIAIPEKAILGPNLELEDKEFLVTVTVNKTEKVQVRCRIFHHASGSEKREMPADFVNVPREALFPEEAEILANMPLPVYKPPETSSKFRLARRRVPKFLKGCYYIYDTEYKDYYNTVFKQHEQKKAQSENK